MSGYLSDRDFEVAAEMDEQLRRNGIARVAAVRASEQLADIEGWDGVTCIDCADPLPELRIQEKRPRCTPCQSDREKENKRHGIY